MEPTFHSVLLSRNSGFQNSGFAFRRPSGEGKEGFFDFATRRPAIGTKSNASGRSAQKDDSDACRAMECRATLRLRSGQEEPLRILSGQAGATFKSQNLSRTSPARCQRERSAQASLGCARDKGVPVPRKRKTTARKRRGGRCRACRCRCRRTPSRRRACLLR